MVAAMAMIVRAHPAPSASGPASSSSGPSRGRVRWALLGVAAGAALPLQGAVNAQLRTDLHAPITVGAFSFAVATTAMAVVLLAAIRLRRTPRPRIDPLRRLPWWGWLGGAVGATYVTAVFLLSLRSAPPPPSA